MPSPFPGMNPYLEQNDTWEDFHHDFITRAREILTGKVGPNYLIKSKFAFTCMNYPLRSGDTSAERMWG